MQSHLESHGNHTPPPILAQRMLANYRGVVWHKNPFGQDQNDMAYK